MARRACCPLYVWADLPVPDMIVLHLGRFLLQLKGSGRRHSYLAEVS